jgi:hypothetical protein
VVTDFLKDKLRPKTDSTTATTDSTRAQPTPKPQERLKDAANKFLDRFKKRTPPTPAPDTTTKPPVAKPDSVKGE